jgi:uncharacterized cupin superfamily protein
MAHRARRVHRLTKESAMTGRADELRRELIRNLHEVPLERQQRAPLYDTRCGRVSAGTVAKKLGAGFDVLAPGMRSCPYHLHHAQEEMFIVIEGAGHLRVAGEMLAIGAGDVMFIPAGHEYPHQIVNTSDAPLSYLSISTQERPELCEYPDSGKFAAFSGGFNAVQRLSADLDYWDGEP